ncbi:MAG TPA: glycosyltransferase [Noviherbaspirillum sp.]|nr:glycosyltransferase [Noviherbaspirillum sp.]
MNGAKMPRVMWLLNHGAARRFEVAMLKRVGITEIFLPKRYPNDPSFRSASVDASEDQYLTIPKDELAVLNAADWYGTPGRDAWEIANRYFDVLFFILHQPEVIKSIVRNFHGIVLWRTYGLHSGFSYTQILQEHVPQGGESALRSLGRRFFFAQAYAHLHRTESEFLAARSLYLPLGLDDCRVNDQWRGSERRIFFVCPTIGCNPYYKAVYRKFVEDFKGLPYTIAGEQPIRVNDSHVLGFVDRDTHEHNMREMRVMFYHSNEPNHIHYHPFEAVRAGMPLVFMAEGMLDRLGGKDLPGRCTSIKEARRKIERILNGDRTLIAHIRDSQVKLLAQMQPEQCVAAWQAGITRIIASLRSLHSAVPAVARRRQRIAVIVPVRYRGGSLSGAKLLAQAIDLGARQAGQPVEVVFAHIDDSACYSPEAFTDLPETIRRRPYTWRLLDRDAAFRAMAYAGLDRTMPSPTYQVPEDGIKQFTDCDLWVIVSDRLEHPLLPLRPYTLMVYDYLQRYQPLLGQALNKKFIGAAHDAERVFVTTDFTRGDTLQFAGLAAEQVIKLPMLTPQFSTQTVKKRDLLASEYFLWTTNLAPHKNHENAFKALTLYYENLDGRLACCITGVGTDQLFKSKLEHLKPLRKIIDNSSTLKKQLRMPGELPEHAYQSRLAGATFLWHAGWIDNGTFSVVEAAQLGVPSLSSAYPAMREIDAQFNLKLQWMDAHDPHNMASQLKQMEKNAHSIRTGLPLADDLTHHSVARLATAYWEAVRECL